MRSRIRQRTINVTKEQFDKVRRMVDEKVEWRREMMAKITKKKNDE